ncbi:MAG TPA: hypothetical protein VGS19_04240 [Streptosporangiaceae bacterium]|nr:hypothetical protein [Streptosporangiaceae bacterium]
MGWGARQIARGLALGGAVLLTVMATGCGAPSFTYVSDSSASTYFKVPYGWHKIDDASLSAALPPNGNVGPGAWQVGYDADKAPTASHVLSAVNQPFVFALVSPLKAATANAMSYDGLRDFLLPVTPNARLQATKVGFPLTAFHLLADTVLVAGQGVHGVRDIFTYTYPDGSISAFDQTALTNSDDTEVYLLLVHCQVSCYLQHHAQINDVVTSFTVRSP